MKEDKLLTIRDVAVFLGVSEKEVIDLAEKGGIPAYKIGGVYIRFKQQEIEKYKRQARPMPEKIQGAQEYTLKDKFEDFFYFNDFYILAALLIALILVVIFRG